MCAPRSNMSKGQPSAYFAAPLFVKNILQHRQPLPSPPKRPVKFHSKIHFHHPRRAKSSLSTSTVRLPRATPRSRSRWYRVLQLGHEQPARPNCSETFDGAVKNETLQLEGWQNVTPRRETAPGGGYEADGEKMAKAYGLRMGQVSERGIQVEMWLVTPPLSYKTAGQDLYLPGHGRELLRELPPRNWSSTTSTRYPTANPSSSNRMEVGIPAIARPKRRMERAPRESGGTGHPATSSSWPSSIPACWGNENAVTYYLDDLGWGRTDLPEMTSDSTQVSMIAAQGLDQVSGKITDLPART